MNVVLAIMAIQLDFGVTELHAAVSMDIFWLCCFHCRMVCPDEWFTASLFKAGLQLSLELDHGTTQGCFFRQFKV